MRKTWRFLFAAAAVFSLAVAGAKAQHVEDLRVGEEVDGPHVRVLRGEDGSRTVFKRTPDNRTLTKRMFSAQGSLVLITIYRMDTQGNPRSCKIYDGKNTELFKVRYGYDRDTGQLMEEQMFDSRVRHLNPGDGSEMPVRRFIYTYDANGQRSKPVAIVLTPGRTADELYGAPSALESNPFDSPPKAPVNPHARPVGGRR